MKYASFRLYVVIVLLAALSLGSCTRKQSAADDTSEDAVPERVSIKLAVFPYMSNAVFHIAIEEGYFADQGLEIERVPVRTNNEMMTAIISGDADVGAPSIHAGLFNVVAKGSPMRLVLPLTTFIAQDCAYIGFLARQEDIDSGVYASISQWKDARMTNTSANTFSTPDYISDLALQTAGLSLADVELKAVSLPAHAEALTSGQVDIVYAIEPWITRMTASEKIGLLIPADGFVGGFTVSLVAYGERLLGDPEVGQKFANAYMRGVRQYMEGKTPRNIELISDFTGLEKSLVEEVCWSAVSTEGAINTELIMKNQRWLDDKGLIDRLLQPEEFLDTRFIAEALEAADSEGS